MDKLIVTDKKFKLIFVDHWHGYSATFEAAERAKILLEKGGFILFHDYSDSANSDPEHVYGVYQGVLDSLLFDENFEFYGIAGCCAFFKKR